MDNRDWTKFTKEHVKQHKIGAEIAKKQAKGETKMEKHLEVKCSPEINASRFSGITIKNNYGQESNELLVKDKEDKTIMFIKIENGKITEVLTDANHKLHIKPI